MIPIEKAPAWVTNLEGRMKAQAKKGLLSAGHRLVGVIVNEVIPAEPRMPVDRGIYRAGWRVRATDDGCVVYNDTPQATFIEDGVRAKNVKPGRAMVDALTQWVIRKGLTTAGKEPGRTMEARNVAWAIAKSMQKKGIFNDGKGLQILGKARRRLRRIIDEEVRAELRRITKE